MNREEKLKSEFNNFLSSKLFLEYKDYYNKLNTKDFIELKLLLSNINNIITLKLTMKFVDSIALLFNFSDENKEKIIDDIQSISPNANGFDIKIEKPIKLVAEVKGNIPINNGLAFGSAQKDAICKDLESLKTGKSKSNIVPADFYKFMVLPDTKETRKATTDLVDSLEKKKENNDYSVQILDESTKEFKIDTVYIAFVQIE